MFITTEGLDGVGKSTVGRGVAKELSARLFLIPPPRGRLKELTDRSLEAHFLYYLSTIYQLGREIDASSSLAVSDCYLLRAISAHEATGVNSAVAMAMSPLIRSVHRPDTNFLLTCQHDKRIKRLEDRNKGIDQFDIVDFKTEQKVLGSYEKWKRILKWDVVQVDTSFRTIDEVIGLIVQSIK